MKFKIFIFCVIFSFYCNAENLKINLLEQPNSVIAKNAEIILVSGYRPTSNTEDVKINIDRPNSTVILVLTSFDQVKWKLNATPKTNISAVIVPANSKSIVNSETKIPLYGIDFSHAHPSTYETNSFTFKKIIYALNKYFLVDQIHVFKGSYNIPNTIEINKLDDPIDELTLYGEKPKKIKRYLDFELLSIEGDKINWSLYGAKKNSQDDILYSVIGTVSPRKPYLYTLNGDNIIIKKANKIIGSLPKLPESFPAFATLNDIAYDSKRNFISVLSLGRVYFSEKSYSSNGEVVYRYDLTKNKWLNYKRLNTFNILHITYDASKDRYVGFELASSGKKSKLTFFDNQMDFLFDVEISLPLSGYSQLYDEGDVQPPPALKILAKGNDIALISSSNNKISNIWHVDLRLESSALTYKKILDNQ